MLTAGIIIIGDEILNGKVTDTISPFLCKRFHANGIQTKQISVVPDDIEMIAADVKKFSNLYDIVVTTGGTGPTHDDLTYEAVGRAFCTTLRIDKELEKCFELYMRNQDKSAKKMVTIPHIAEVLMVDLEVPLAGSLTKFPIVKTRNVFNFPGAPSFTHAIFTAMEMDHFENSNNLFFSREIYLNVFEINVIPILNETIVEFKERVHFGSYPLIGCSQKRGELTKIYLESSSLVYCLDAEEALLKRLPLPWYVPLNLDGPNFNIFRRLMFYDCEVATALRLSYQIIEKCFAEYDISETFICFNGGKDCTVLVNLIYYYCMTKNMKHCLKLLYFQDPDSFLEVDTFIEEIKNNYQVDLSTFPIPMKKSLSEFLQTEPKRKVCFLGQRNSDPRSRNLKSMQETDSDWPKLMRIFPLLHWSYRDIWDFIRIANVPYCSLYNQGFTSLGSKCNTKANPALKIVIGKNIEYYRPAFLLSNDECERLGRLNPGGDVSSDNS